MAYLSAVSSLDSVIQWEINDPGQTTGGAGGGANAQAQALLNRLKYYFDTNMVNATSATNIKAVNPTQAGITDANAIAAATGATLYARLYGILNAVWGLGSLTPAAKGVSSYTYVENTTTQTLTAITASNAAYFLHAYIPGISSAGASCFGIVVASNDGSVIYTALKTATNASVSVSGANLQATQTTGLNKDVYWTLTPLQ